MSETKQNFHDFEFGNGIICVKYYTTNTLKKVEDSIGEAMKTLGISSLPLVEREANKEIERIMNRLEKSKVVDYWTVYSHFFPTRRVKRYGCEITCKVVELDKSYVSFSIVRNVMKNGFKNYLTYNYIVAYNGQNGNTPSCIGKNCNILENKEIKRNLSKDLGLKRKVYDDEIIKSIMNGFGVTEYKLFTYREYETLHDSEKTIL